MHGEVCYRNAPKFSDTKALANSADPEQTAPRGGAVLSGSTLLAIPSTPLGHNFSMERSFCLNFGVVLVTFLVSENLGTLRYMYITLRYMYISQCVINTHYYLSNLI